MAGIPLTLNFDLAAALPLDSRLVVANVNQLTSITPKYSGMIVYAANTKNLYFLENVATNSWSQISTGLKNVVFTTGDQTINDSKTFITTGIYYSGGFYRYDKKSKTVFEENVFINKINNQTTFGIYNHYFIDQDLPISGQLSDLPIGIRTGNIVNLFYNTSNLNNTTENNLNILPTIMVKYTGNDYQNDIIPIINHNYYSGRALKKLNYLNREATQLPDTIVYTTGAQTISGDKTFEAEEYRFEAEEYRFEAAEYIFSGAPVSFIGERPTVNGTGVLLSGEAAQLPSTLVYNSGLELTINENHTGYIPQFKGINTLDCLVSLVYIATSGLLRLPTGSHNLYNGQEERLNIRLTGPNMAGGTFYIQDADYAFINGQETNIGWRNIYETKVIPYNSLITLYRQGNNISWQFYKNNFVADLENQTQYFVNNTGNQTISGQKSFENEIKVPYLSSKNLGGFRIDLDNTYLGKNLAVLPDTPQSLNWGTKELSGQWKTNKRLLVNNTGVLLNGEAVVPLVNINNITENFIFDTSFNTKLLTINVNSNITGTVPSGLPTGYNVSFVQIGNGQLFITGDSGVLIRQRLNLYNTAGQYAIASLLHHNENQFILYGDLI